MAILIALATFLSFKYFFCIKKNTTYIVSYGSNLSNIGNKMQQSGLISSGIIFKIYSKFWLLLNECDRIYIGEYEFFKNENYSSVLNKFCNDKSLSKTITIVEGAETREVIDMINNCGDLVGGKVNFSQKDEGSFLPETYTFKTGTLRSAIIEKMRVDMVNFLDKEWKQRDGKIKQKIKTKKDALILASIVEKEAKVDFERPIIAGVYLNRLDKNMRLEADPTTIYEITKGKYKLQRPLKRKDLQVVGEYNTYKKFGLPKTPICNPSKKSILAVLHPEHTDYIYFVAKSNGNGEHAFSKTYAGHINNIINAKKNAKK